MKSSSFALLLVAFNLSIAHSGTSVAQEFIPRKQTQPPGPPLSPAEALKKFRVPEGFHVELVAAEPDLMNPVAMAFDDRGRIYVTESFEYPRREPGPGRDRIKILEDTDGDGRVDSVKIFAEGLNIPSGIAVGHGGVWVGNAPDILFLEDTDGDDKADRKSVVVTGFGREDTHELPNAFTWGPDGCLYGLNGVFNPCRVEQDGKTFEFTCAMFRIDPRTRKFDLFCEGTSNPWGIAFDHEGSAFVSACVIDHLWHLTETGYYHRQGGPYPPYTWKAESIVKHKHQLAAYCGIEYFDSEAYPAPFRDKLYMGNIHGSCLNVDRIQRAGATYEGFGEPDFLTANDVWFMPVSQKVGPDGCLYILDWYDRYHCYQDANADPLGIDRGRGRLYRVVYGKRPSASVSDFSKLSHRQLIDSLCDPNIYVRQKAQLELCERGAAIEEPDVAKRLLSLSLDATQPLKFRLHALWSMVGAGRIEDFALSKWLNADEPEIRSWAVRTAGHQQINKPDIIERICSLARDPDPRVQLQVAIAIPKLDRTKSSKTLLDILSRSPADPLIPRIVWRNLLPRLKDDRAEIMSILEVADKTEKNPLTSLVPRIASYWIGETSATLEKADDRQQVESVLRAAEIVFASSEEQSADILRSIIAKAESSKTPVPALVELVKRWLKHVSSDPSLAKLSQAISRSENHGGNWGVCVESIKAIVGDEAAIARIEAKVLAGESPPNQRIALLQTVTCSSTVVLSKALEQEVRRIEEGKKLDERFAIPLFELVIDRGSSEDIDRLVRSTVRFPRGLQATMAERFCQRVASATLLLDEIAAGKLNKDIVSPNQIRLLAGNPSASIRDQVQKIWGKVNTADSAALQRIIKETTAYLKSDARGDAQRGLRVYDRICGQCHLLHGRGYEVGPNITSNGRGNFDQLVVSVFDPSLVIGEAYKSLTVRTDDGRVLNGIVVERSPKQIVLKLQGNKQEVIKTEEIEELKENDKSLMPEGLHEQMTRQELADLFALLSLEGPFDQPQNSTIPGTPNKLHANPQRVKESR